ncbi:MAG: hypothetical protein HY567_00320 [Candidatus Kerfeldbacteria bacterium]|nr:hypothetical protein [Candidatus Kerfeldbacteria bacterium]
MGRIIAQLMMALRSVLSRFGFASAGSSMPEKDPLDVRKSAILLSDGNFRETPEPYLVESESAHTLRDSKSEEPARLIEVQSDRSIKERETDSEAVEMEAAEVSVRRRQPMQNEDSPTKCEPLFKGAYKEGFGSVTSIRDSRAQEEKTAHVTDGEMEQAPTRHQLQMGDIESPDGEPTRSEEKNDVLAERDSAGSAEGTRCFSPHGETSHEASASPTDSGTLDGREDENGSVCPEDIGAGDGVADTKHVEEEAHQNEVPPRSNFLLAPDTQSEQLTDISSTNVCEQGATGSEFSSASPVSVPNEYTRGREDLPEDQTAASAGVQVPDSGGVGCPPVEEGAQNSTEEYVQTAVDDTRVPSPRRPTPAEDAREYTAEVWDVSEVDCEYARWNNAVVEHLLLARPPSDEAYLCINPRILARVFEEAGFGSLIPEEAERQFSTAVARVYRGRLLGHSGRLRVLRRCSGGAPPDCVAFLAASVLAAFRMQSDEELSGNAYYRRLADLLGCETQGVHPVGFDPVVFESLWVFLCNWLREVHKRRLAMPKGDVGFRRFVALPLAHVPLRSLDIEKLPAFFSWARYQPGSRVRHDRLLADLKQWQQSRNMLTPTGAKALSDDRSPAVLAQVSAELDSWDGSFVESTGRRTALVEIQFDVVQRIPVFSYLPRRPPGFPGVFDGGERVFEASDEGWYDPAEIRPEDGELLESGFEWFSHSNCVHFTLKRPGAVVVPFTPSPVCSGFLSSRRLLRGVRCSILCRNNVVPAVKEYLSEVVQTALSPVSHPSLPNGWSMFRNFSACVHIEPPPGLEALEVDPNVELIVMGGLRIGRRWSWLNGAPPRILVSGVEAQDGIKINGAPMGVIASGEVLTDEVFAGTGEYLIEAGSVRRRIEIARPRMAVRRAIEEREPIDGRGRKLALPRGSWTIIGCSPGQVCHSRGEFFRGTIASCPFHPSWAVQVGAGPGAVVAAFTSPRPPQTVGLHELTGRTRKMLDRWTSTIYEAHIRRPRFIGLNGAVPDASVVDVWRQYTALAKEIKRRLKRPQ